MGLMFDRLKSVSAMYDKECLIEENWNEGLEDYIKENKK